MIHFYQPVALRLRMAVRGLSWAASAGRTPQPSVSAPREGLFSGEKGIWVGSPTSGVRAVCSCRDPPPGGESLWHESPAAKWARERAMNQLFWNRSNVRSEGQRR